ncbi:MBL fold metallo-hydrolase [Spongiibacter sp. KMU-158]|uniref:MBL fold metallo-hydrolase n=2 Tax=Spongiibacter pelagi TaxID=2760804 RepID=A0A927BZA0_9GAMM|nr:MBL fold metallo-hydrolase [Spongiibacter pelagi]
MIPSVFQTLRPGVHRLIAPNPGIMTGPGTNTYLLGEKRFTVIDPGPAIDAHLDAIAKALQEQGASLERVVVTHTHPDHSPAASHLAERFEVPLVGRVIADDGHQDTAFDPDHHLEHDDVFALDDGSALRAIHTPGHVDNHFCFLHDASGTVFTGDHIMQGSTVVIIPPAGDMADYMASLRKLLDYPVKALAPGHGSVIETPVEEIQGLIKHRQGREDKIVGVLKQLAGNLDDLVVHAYNDVDPAIHEIAKLSLWAHLLKLQKEGRAQESGGHWVLI